MEGVEMRIAIDVGSSTARCATSGTHGGAQLVPDPDDGGTTETALKVSWLERGACVGADAPGRTRAKLLDAWQSKLHSGEHLGGSIDQREEAILGLALLFRKLTLD